MVTARRVRKWATQALIAYALFAFIVLAASVTVAHAVATDANCEVTSTATTIHTECTDTTDNLKWARVAIALTLGGLLVVYPVLALAHILEAQAESLRRSEDNVEHAPSA